MEAEVLYFYSAEELDDMLTNYFHVRGINSYVRTEFEEVMNDVRFVARCIEEDETETLLSDEAIITILTNNEVRNPSHYLLIPYMSEEENPRFKLSIRPKARQSKR